MSVELSVNVRRRRERRIKWLERGLAAVLILIGGRAAAAATVYVDGNVGMDSPTCGTAPGPAACRTIQTGVNNAGPGDTVMVAPSVYPEPAAGPLTINKKLTLLGAGAGVDARTRVGPESIITDPQGTSITASNVVFDGFTVQNSTTSAFTGFGIFMAPATSGTQILNNIIANNIAGIGLGGSNVTIRHNAIRANNAPGAASGSGIYTDQFVGGNSETNILIEENDFTGNDDAGIDVSNTDASGGVFNLNVLSNAFDANGRALVLFNTHNSTIQDNRMTNSTTPLSAAVRLFDNNTNLTITFDNATNGAGHAVRISFTGAVGGPSSGVVINENNIGVAGAANFVGDGLLVSPGGHNGTVDAECNWWGSPTGPISLTNPGGTGEEVVGNADFTPWLTAPFPVGACLGGAPSTPGKVTGGGQIPGEDPLFSPLGELISLPAIVPSLSNSNSNASFGFVAKCCPESGNLEYNDHGADVRIKATSVDHLAISSPGTACPTTPGSKHATFTGTANVIRPSGTTTEPYTVDVDDCGEPGTMDTFGIKTTTYANGPHTLIGGNVQIR